MPDPSRFLQALQDWSEVFQRRSMHAFIRFTRREGLSVPQFGSLLHLHHGGPCAVSDIATHLDVSSAAASQMLERLVQQGWIQRSEDPADRRSKQIVLTPEGKQVVQQGIQAMHAWIAELGEALPAEEQAEMADSLERLARTARSLEDPGQTPC
jgi:DNA-binding MarR family transcriptional regulator